MNSEISQEKSVLGELTPGPVFSFFEQICRIPHGSGHTAQISDFLVQFAKDRGISYRQDEMGNVILFQEASKGYEDRQTVILQGHMDMVCVAEEGYEIDFEKEGLKLLVEDGYVTAQGTSLGGDDGIAVAMALAILDSDEIPHPPLEVVITVDEEVGMLGAAGIELSDLKGKRLLNIDSEDEGYLLVSCAGGATVTAELDLTFAGSDVEVSPMGILSISSLVGGHSGVEIDKGRANGCLLLGRALEGLSETVKAEGGELLIKRVEGGGKDNAIPSAATAQFVLAGIEKEKQQSVWRKLSDETKQWKEIFCREYGEVEPTLSLVLTTPLDGGKDTKDRPFDSGSTDKILSLLRILPNGIQSMSRDIPGLVQTSLNLGILKTDASKVSASYLVRSSLSTEKEEVISRLKRLTDLLGGTITVMGDYPAWEYRKESALRDLMKEVFIEQYHKEPVLQMIHAGVECGLFAEKIADMDAVSFGPDLKNIHSPKEAMDIASVQRTWEFLLEVLKRLD